MTLNTVIIALLLIALAVTVYALLRALRYNDDPAWPSRKQVKGATDEQIKGWMATLPVARTEKQLRVMCLIARRYIEIEDTELHQPLQARQNLND